MFNNEYMYILIVRTAILFDVCCVLFISKYVVSGIYKIFKGATKDIVEVIEKLEKDKEEQQKKNN